MSLPQHDALLKKMVENYKRLHMPTMGTGDEQEQSVLGFVEEELPHCDVSREAVVYMQKQQADWLQSSKAILERHRLQPRVAKTVDCVEREHEQFRRYLRKDAAASKRLNDLQKRRSEMAVVRGKLRDLKHSQVRARRYFQEYEQGLKQKMQHLDTAEEKAFRQAFGQVMCLSKDDMRDLEGHIRCREEQRMAQLQEGAKQLRQLYQETLTCSAASDISRKGLHEKGKGLSAPVMSEDHRALVREVREGVEWLECRLGSAEDRVHHRHLHAGLMAEKIPKPVLKRKV